MSDLCCNRLPIAYSRRDMLRYAACGFGSLAFAAMSARASGASLLGMSNARDDEPRSPLAAKKPHFAPTAKRIIFLCMAGAPSHVDTFDYKPELAARDGKRDLGRTTCL